MPNKRLWIGESQPEEQGSFCDTSSGYAYDHGNVTDVTDAEASAIERGDEVIFLDAPIDPEVVYGISPGQEFNLLLTEEDGQGVSTPPKYGPGY